MQARQYPLGANKTFRRGARIVIPLLKLLTHRDWRGVENIPQSGAMIAISNHISYADSLIFAHFLYGNGRAPRFLAKASLFRIPVVGRILASAEQVPVERTSTDPAARKHALEQGLRFLNEGNCLGFYPEGTITRDVNYWPMVGKTGLARIAVASKVPVIPCAQWGAQRILPAYSKFPRFLSKTLRRQRVIVEAGKPLDFSPWFGKEDDHDAMVEATAYAMGVITRMLEEIRGECAPTHPFDPHASELPRTGNFQKRKREKS